MRFEVILVYFINALINLITPYIIWKTKTWQFICNSFHLSKVDWSFIGLVGTAESRKFLGAQHTSKEFSHKKTHFVIIEIFLYVVGNTSGSMHKKSWVTRKSGKCRILRLNTNVVFFHGEGLFFVQMKWRPRVHFVTNITQIAQYYRESTIWFKYIVIYNMNWT